MFWIPRPPVIVYIHVLVYDLWPLFYFLQNARIYHVFNGWTCSMNTIFWTTPKHIDYRFLWWERDVSYMKWFMLAWLRSGAFDKLVIFTVLLSWILLIWLRLTNSESKSTYWSLMSLSRSDVWSCLNDSPQTLACLILFFYVVGTKHNLQTEMNNEWV